MSTNDTTSAIIDNLLKLGVMTTVLSAGIVAPNLILALDKPLQKYLKTLDKRAQEREMRRIVSYMKNRDLIKGDYEHGLSVTEKGQKRLSSNEFAKLKIRQPMKWDKKWRIIFFDIPEQHKSGRDALTHKLKQIGFIQLQRSIWIHPHPCREVITKITSHYKIANYVSCIKTDHIDNQEKLIIKFKNIIN